MTSRNNHLSLTHSTKNSFRNKKRAKKSMEYDAAENEKINEGEEVEEVHKINKLRTNDSKWDSGSTERYGLVATPLGGPHQMLPGLVNVPD